MVRRQAVRPQQIMNEYLPQSNNTYFTLSQGRLNKFQNQFNLRSIRSNGERGDADEAAAATESPKLQQLVTFSRKRDVFNGDKYGHFYKMLPDRIIARSQLPRRKNEKARLAYLPCCNATGKEKVPLMCIGKAREPRWFNKKTGNQLGFDYHAN